MQTRQKQPRHRLEVLQDSKKTKSSNKPKVGIEVFFRRRAYAGSGRRKKGEHCINCGLGVRMPLSWPVLLSNLRASNCLRFVPTA